MIGHTPSHRRTVWTALLVLAVVGIGGYVMGWYARVPWYDSFAHGTGSAALTLAIGIWLYRRAVTGATDAPIALILTLTGLGMGIGAGWEMLEYGYDHLTGPKSVILPKPDTIADLVWDGVGALIGATLVLAIVRGTRETGG